METSIELTHLSPPPPPPSLFNALYWNYVCHRAELPKTSLARELPNEYTGGGKFGCGSIAMESNTLFNKYTGGRQVESEGTIEPRPALTPSKCVIAGKLVSGGTGVGLVPPSTSAFDSSEPVTPDAAREPVTPDAVREPVTPDAAREPVTPDAVREPVTPDAVREPVTPDAVREPVTPDAVREPVTPDAVREPVTPDAVREPVTPDAVREPTHDSERTAEQVTTPGDGHPTEVVTPGNEPPEAVTPFTADEPPIDVVTPSTADEPPIEVVTPGNKPPIEVLGNEPPIEVVTLSTADEPPMEVEPHSLTGNDSVAATPVSFGAQVANLRKLKGRVRMVVKSESRIFEMRVSRHTYGASLVPVSVRIQSMRKTSVFAKWHTISKGVVTFKDGGVSVLHRTKRDCRLQVQHRIGCLKQGRTDSKRKNRVKQRIYRADRIWKQGVKHRTWKPGVKHRIRKQVVKHRIRKQLDKHRTDRIWKQRVNKKHGVKHRIQQRTIENNYYRRGVPLRSRKDVGKDSTNLKNDHRLKSPEDMSELPLASKKSKPEYSTMDIIDELFSTV